MQKTLTLSSLALAIGLCTQMASADVYSDAAQTLQTATHNGYLDASGTYYHHSRDSGFDFWWNANGLDALTEGYMRTRSEADKQKMKVLLHGIRDKHGSYLNHFYDDMEWLALASIKAYLATNDGEYLDVAKLLWNDILTGRSPEYMNSISWNKGCHPACKNAISNSPAALIGAQLYRITGDSSMLDRAKEIHYYVKTKLVSPTGGVYDSWDAVKNETNANEDWVFSYNVGMFMAASQELFQVTGEQAYLDDAKRAAEHAFNYRLRNGIFYTNENGQGDGGLFKGIFMRSLRQLALEENLDSDTRKRYLDAIQFNSDVLRLSGTRADQSVGPVWSDRPSDSAGLEYSTQLSGVMLHEAAVATKSVSLYQDITYAGYQADFGVGRYSKNDLIRRGARDNDVTSFVVPADMQVTFFDGEQFDGDSVVFTSNRSWIGGDWNDRVSSMIVASRDITDYAGTIRSEYNNTTNESIDKVIDNDAGTKFLGVNNNGGWIEFEAEQAQVVNEYTITVGNDAPERDPLNWTLLASNDGANWYTLDSRSGEDFANRYQKRRFSVNNNTAYRFYRLDLSQNSGSLYQLAEWQLLSPKVENAVPSFSHRIQAEGFSAMNGVTVETGMGTEGDSVGYIDAGDWMAYNDINIPAAGQYQITYRIATGGDGAQLSLDVNAGANVLGITTLPNTGGWTNWQTVTQSVTLDAGTFAFGIFSPNGGFNLDWWQIDAQ